MDDKLCFRLWHSPHWSFGLGIVTKQQIHITWLEKLHLCDLKYTNLKNMFTDVAKHQGYNDIDGLAMTIIDEEFYEEIYKVKYKDFQAARKRGEV